MGRAFACGPGSEIVGPVPTALLSGVQRANLAPPERGSCDDHVQTPRRRIRSASLTAPMPSRLETSQFAPQLECRSLRLHQKFEQVNRYAAELIAYAVWPSPQMSAVARTVMLRPRR